MPRCANYLTSSDTKSCYDQKVTVIGDKDPYKFTANELSLILNHLTNELVMDFVNLNSNPQLLLRVTIKGL